MSESRVIDVQELGIKITNSEFGELLYLFELGAISLPLSAGSSSPFSPSLASTSSSPFIVTIFILNFLKRKGELKNTIPAMRKVIPIDIISQFLFKYSTRCCTTLNTHFITGVIKVR